VVLAGHRVAGLDRRHVREALRGVVGLGGVQRRDRDEGGERQPERVVVDRGGVARDDAAGLQPPDPGLHRGHRQPGLRRERRQGRAAVGRQEPHQQPVGVVVEAGHAAQGSHRRLGRLADVWTAIPETLGTVPDTVLQAARDRPAVLAAGLLALVAVSWTTSWRLTRGVVTIAHEGGHALVAVLAGRGLQGIRLHADSSGVTTSVGRRGGFGLVLTFLAGYPAPAVLGLVVALLVAEGWTAASLWLVVALLLATLLLIRNAFGVVSVLATGAVVGAVSWWGDPRLQSGFAAALAWFLLFGGLRSVRELQRGRRRVPARIGGESDADALARLTGVPGGMWATLFWLVGTVAVITAAWVLLRGVT
jgi:hypothetical protein